jgi:hypothetical protein
MTDDEMKDGFVIDVAISCHPSSAKPCIELRLMSFGRPPSISTGFQVTPPDRGSFPLDHYGLYPYRAENSRLR